MKHTHVVTDGTHEWFASVVDGALYVCWSMETDSDDPSMVADQGFDNISVEEVYSRLGPQFSVTKIGKRK